MESRALQLKVTLRHTKPPIWRRLEVRGDMTLGQLHDVLQLAMGWTDTHLHQFMAEGNYYGTPDPEFGLDRVNEDKTRVDQVLRKPKDRLLYEYDFGDGWEHDVLVEKVLELEPGPGRYPRVTGGRRACPPENCGGFPGYYRVLDALRDPSNPERDELLEFVADDYDPAYFDLGEVNELLHGVWIPVTPRRSKR